MLVAQSEDSYFSRGSLELQSYAFIFGCPHLLLLLSDPENCGLNGVNLVEFSWHSES